MIATTIKRAENLPSYKVDDSLIFLDRQGGYCYALNPTGARIWDLIAHPVSVADICDTLCGEFAVDRETCEREVIEILDEMRKAELLQ
jgi:hypothetical protein